MTLRFDVKSGQRPIMPEPKIRLTNHDKVKSVFTLKYTCAAISASSIFRELAVSATM